MIKLIKVSARKLQPVSGGCAWWDEYGILVSNLCSQFLVLGEICRADTLILKALKFDSNAHLGHALFALNNDTTAIYVVRFEDDIVQLIGRSKNQGAPEVREWAENYLSDLYDNFLHQLGAKGVPITLDDWLEKCAIAVSTKEQLALVTDAKAALND